MDGIDAFFAVMFWSAVALPMIGLTMCLVVGILITPVEMNRVTRRVVVGVGAVLILMALPGLGLFAL
ncbi:MAG: hypothetical protein ACJ72L_21770 [Marmoricola sp.]